MRSILFLGILVCVSAQAASVSGEVSAQGGAKLANAQVFIEPGLGGALVETKTDANGAFVFDDAPSGLVGIFAYAEGYAFGGLSQTIGPADSIKDIHIGLLSPGSAGGRIIDPRGNPIPGARITRALLQGDAKVGIPFSKLEQFGFKEPASDEEGRFLVEHLPVGAKVALKVGHQSYAQQGVGGISVGDMDVRVQMYEGVSIEGSVQSRDGGQSVSNASIIFRTAREPYDTIIAKTDASGHFSARLNPGYYLYQSASMELRSPGWEKLTVSGKEPVQQVTLRVAGTGKLHGEVRDAATGNPVAGAKVALAAFGAPAAVVTTGPSGTYEFAAVEGENSVRVEPAAGFLEPDRPVLTLTAKQGENLEVPTFWLAPLPGYKVQVVDANEKPIAGIIVRLIRPMQYRWYVTGVDGKVSLEVASVPKDGKIVGMAERPTEREGALFSIQANAATEAKIQLLALGTVSGTVVTSKEKPIEGAIVGGLFQSDADDEPLPLWRTATGADGRFTWDCVVPFVPAACLATAGDDLYGRSVPFNINPSSGQDLGRIVIAEPEKSKEKKISKVKGLAGKKLEWVAARPLAGPAPTDAVGKPVVVVYTTPEEAAMVVDALSGARKILSTQNVAFVAIVDGVFSGDAKDVIVLQGKAPGPATTCVLDSTGKVTLETVGMPPAFAVWKGAQG